VGVEGWTTGSDGRQYEERSTKRKPDADGIDELRGLVRISRVGWSWGGTGERLLSQALPMMV
jgi:hypothetical protein